MPRSSGEGLVELRVEGVAKDSNDAPVVVLREAQGKRSLPIWIGLAEAWAISLELEGQKMARPMTHDLIVSILGELSVKILRVVINDAHDSTYFARLVLRSGGQDKEMDCRPSDGIAIALRARVPIMIPEDLLERLEVERKERTGRHATIVDTGGETIH